MTGIISDNVGRTSGLIKAASGGGGGVWTLIKTLTSDGSDSDLSFVDGTDDVVLDSTYPIYKFTCNTMHCAASDGYFQVNFRDGSTAYDATKTATFYRAEHGAGDDATGFGYNTHKDLAQSTAAMALSNPTGDGNDENSSGHMWLFNPSSTTFVKHFMSEFSTHDMSDYAQHCFIGGYCNVTAAIDGVQFTFSSGDIQSGTIKLYGLGDS